MKQSFRREQRIRRPSLFDFVFKKGKLIKGRWVNIWVYRGVAVFKKSLTKAPPQIGIIVSRKTARSAVKRNLWKRRIRETFRHHQHSLKSGTLLLVQSRRQEEIPSYKDIESDLLQLWSKAEIINEK